MNLRNLSIKAKLGFSFGALAVTVLAVVALSMLSLSREHHSFTSYVHDDAHRAELANAVLKAANARAIGARNLVLVTDAKERHLELAHTTAAHEKVAALLKTLRAAIDDAKGAGEEERKLFAAMATIETRYGALAEEIVGMVMKDRREEAVVKMNAECRPLLAALVAAVDRYLEYVSGSATRSLQVSEEAFVSQRTTMIIFGAFAVAMALLLAVLITRAIVAPINRAVEIAKTVAEGDLRSAIDVTGKDEPAHLLRALKHMNERLVDLVGHVRQASDSIATGSQQIASGSADLSTRTEQQASSLQETAASMEQMSSTVKANADSAQQATRLASDASAAATQGGEAVALVVATMQEINAGSKRIAEIIGTIDGIAFQTNILALNAAVEAARAGDQGRGFAVVAGEVRVLAQRSAAAAKEIKSLIGSSVERVEAGSRLVDDARGAMDGIVARVREVSDLIADISAATHEQADGIGQVGSAVTVLDHSTQQNAALVEESTAAAMSLKQQADELANVVGLFKLAA
jgi:methyl-accepting chemotaxis protein-1 (serine sensor receptor)